MEQGVGNCGAGSNRPLLDSKSIGELVFPSKQHNNDIKEVCVRESLLEEESITAIELEVYAEGISEARQLDIIHEGNHISEPKNNPDKIHSPEESSEDSPANTCDIICPEFTTEKGIHTPVTFVLSMPGTHSDTQDQCGSEPDNACTDAVNDTKCAQIPEEFSQTSVVINEEAMLIPKCGMETYQQVQLPGEDLQSSMPLCQNVQLHTKFDERGSTMMDDQREVLMENKCDIPSVEVQAEDEVCTVMASMPKPAVSGCKPGWCGAMELVVLSSVGMEEEKFSFIESDNELEDDKDSGQDGCEELNDNKESQWETTIVESNKEGEGSSKKGELPITTSANVCASISDNQQDCIDVSRYKEDTCHFPVELEEEENEPASKRPRCSSVTKHDESMLEPEVVSEGLQTTNELETDDGSETLLQGLPTDSARHWPALPNAPACHQLYREGDDDEGGSPPDDGENGRTDPSTFEPMSMPDGDNQLVPEEYSQVHNQLIPDQTFQEQKKAYSLYSDTHVGLDKPVSNRSNSLVVLESLPSVVSLPLADQVIPQSRYPSCFEKREAIAPKLSQTQVAPVSCQQSDAFSRRPRLRLGLSKKQKTKRLHLN